jgi:hypothetical protein
MSMLPLPLTYIKGAPLLMAAHTGRSYKGHWHRVALTLLFENDVAPISTGLMRHLDDYRCVLISSKCRHCTGWSGFFELYVKFVEFFGIAPEFKGAPKFDLEFKENSVWIDVNKLCLCHCGHIDARFPGEVIVNDFARQYALALTSMRWPGQQ